MASPQVFESHCPSFQKKQQYTLLEVIKLTYICSECLNDICDGFYDDDDPLTLPYNAYCKDCYVFCKQCTSYYERRYASINRNMCCWCYEIPDVKQPE